MQKYTLHSVTSLKPGQSISICWNLLKADFPAERHNGVVFSPPDRLLENIIGSAYEYGYNTDPLKNRVVFFRLEKPITEADALVYVSPDRRQYYSFSGSLYRRNDKKYFV